jgi:hypothetical protein
MTTSTVPTAAKRKEIVRHESNMYYANRARGPARFKMFASRLRGPMWSLLLEKNAGSQLDDLPVVLDPALVSYVERGTAAESPEHSSSDPNSNLVVLRPVPVLSTYSDADPTEMEARRSEASSSHLLEAAAPLIAKAMRLRPVSDDLSAESFFAGDAFLSKHWSKKSGWDLGLRGSERSSARIKRSSGYAPSIEVVEEDEEEEKEKEPGQDGTKDGWTSAG